MNEKNVKIKTQAHASIGQASSFNVQIINSFNLDLRLKDTESANISKLNKLLTELRRFKFVTTLISVFRKTEGNYRSKYSTFYSRSKTEIIINERDIDDVFESVYTTIILNIQKSLGKVQAGLLIQSWNIILIFQSIIS